MILSDREIIAALKRQFIRITPEHLPIDFRGGPWTAEQGL